MKETKIQWHPGFVAAMNLELAKNRQDLIFEKEYNLNTKPLMGDERMCQALMEIMEPQLLLREKKVMEEGIKEGIKRGINGTVDTLRAFGHGELEIKKAIMQKYVLSEEEAEEYLNENV